jgi:hypothetical protein
MCVAVQDNVHGGMSGCDAAGLQNENREPFGRSSPQTRCRAVWAMGMAMMSIEPDRTKPYSSSWGSATDIRVVKNALRGVEPKGAHRLLIHVGKTCGTSVAMSLHTDCLQRGCPHSLPEVHVNPTSPRALDQRTAILITVRDPVERLISAFNYVQDRKVHGCYATAEAFLNGIAFDVSPCGDLVRSMFATPPASFSSHFNMGLCFYVGGIMDILCSHRIWVIETHSCASDTYLAMKWLNMSLPKAANHANPSSRAEKKTNISAQTADRLRQFLDYEFFALDALKAMSVNKKKRSKALQKGKYHTLTLRLCPFWT